MTEISPRLRANLAKSPVDFACKHEPSGYYLVRFAYGRGLMYGNFANKTMHKMIEGGSLQHGRRVSIVFTDYRLPNRCRFRVGYDSNDKEIETMTCVLDTEKGEIPFTHMKQDELDQLLKMIEDGSLAVYDLPLSETKTMYLFQFVNDPNQFIYVNDKVHDAMEGRYENDLPDTRLWIGSLGNMKEEDITGMQRYRDGGTTYIFTKNNQLFSPSPFNKVDKPLWKGSNPKLDLKLERVDLTTFDESTLGIPNVPCKLTELRTICDVLFVEPEALTAMQRMDFKDPTSLGTRSQKSQ